MTAVALPLSQNRGVVRISFTSPDGPACRRFPVEVTLIGRPLWTAEVRGCSSAP